MKSCEMSLESIGTHYLTHYNMTLITNSWLSKRNLKQLVTRDTVKYSEYCKCRNKVRAITRKTRKQFELQVAQKYAMNLKTSGIMPTRN